ncbi:hypothetical protein THYS13_15160 [Thermoanaerobacter sp. YS13]|uniref:hypothetical protein n=1 Tax=Thermoanaerobacter sp. YS13 TaxID=1511746 RepID=UPI000575AB5F|nr:hypothetical protein [Thermoanaerobacter sp. YS13]KHO63389.1 hypothetical protein THYS13_15160 [Thermoanaerobacter sp. YS13]
MQEQYKNIEIEITDKKWDEAANIFAPQILMFVQDNFDIVEESRKLLNEFNKIADKMDARRAPIAVAAMGLLIQLYEDFLKTTKNKKG